MALVRQSSIDPASPLISRYERKLRIWETSQGATAGWIGEYQGRPAATLDDARCDEMFWWHYEFTVVTDDPELAPRLQSFDFWRVDQWQSLVWRNRLFGDVAQHGWFPAASPFNGAGRLRVRDLHLDQAPPRPWDEFILWRRRITGRKFQTGPGPSSGAPAPE